MLNIRDIMYLCIILNSIYFEIVILIDTEEVNTFNCVPVIMIGQRHLLYFLYDCY
jgi:hypothetical protein